ncbi:hypothetical protein rpr22_0758 [Rickettsia prowazekii str. Rp22]|uniref:Uncharacterized protein n=1 Tax=Rickettsia prowazekii (strain Rp22) TaxID=449216 RepID=D5AXX8_RICPP|nr:hypothetical protein rpr22_0758 [Rickettsia prowazekii str. Rp22]
MLLYEVVPNMSRDTLNALAAQPTMPLVT